MNLLSFLVPLQAATTAVYLKESGKQDIVNPSDMSKTEVKGVCEFLINMKKVFQWYNILQAQELLVFDEEEKEA